MGDPSLPSQDKPSWSREGITIAVSLIGAGASLNSWFPAFQVLGAILVVAGLVVLAASMWPLVRPALNRLLPSGWHRALAGVVCVVVVVGIATGGMWFSRTRTQGLQLNAPQISEPGSTFSLLDVLPDEKELPVDLVEKETGKRTGEALARLRSSGADELMQRLLEWGFIENAYRSFGRPADATPSPNTVFLLEVSVHRLGSAGGAAGALNWFASDRSTLSGLAFTPIEQIGEEARAIAGEQENEDGSTAYREASVYTRSGPIMIRVTAQSKKANPIPTAIAVAKLALEKIPA